MLFCLDDNAHRSILPFSDETETKFAFAPSGVKVGNSGLFVF
jgi:hypothetical protein